MTNFQRERRRRRHRSMKLTALLLLACPFVFAGSASRWENRRVHKCAFAFLPRLHFRPSSSLETSKSVSSGRFLRSRLDLFSVKPNKNEQWPPKEKEKNTDHKPEQDFNWIEGLSRWPLKPPVSNNENEASLLESDERDRGGFIPIPLANLINVEAILMANGEETLDDTIDLELYAAGNETMVSLNRTAGAPAESTPLAILPDLEELANWEQLANNIRRTAADAGSGTAAAVAGTTDALLKEASNRIEYFVSEASTAVSPHAVKDLVQRAGRALSSQGADPGALVKMATNLAREQGLNVSEAAERASYTTNLVKLANGLLQNGYARGDRVKATDNASTTLAGDGESKALFSDFRTAKTVAPSTHTAFVAKAAELGSICGAIYQETVPRTLGLGHSIVANATTEDVSWMVTDCIAAADQFLEPHDEEDSKPMLVRTLTIRGFDASDESIDRERLLNRICTASPEPLENGVAVHSGLVEIARAIYSDVKPYIDMTAPEHSLVLTGHSVGGSLSILLLFLMVQDYGVDYVRDKVLRVYTFGSPPVTTISHGFYDGEVKEYLRSIEGLPESHPEMEPFKCDILEAFALPCSIVYGFVQPWDPIVRLFSDIDPLYPLLGDMGEDGVTVYASGPPRTLRPITRAIFEAWDGWPRFRDTFRATVDQNYTSVGVQHILLPDSVRYLSDRFVAANINVPPIEHVLRISSKELLPGLEKNFPLDPFRISFVPAAIRGFIHHFYPAYGFPVVDFANKKLKRQAVSKKVNDGEKEDYRIVLDRAEDTLLDITGTKETTKMDESGREKGKAKGGWSAPSWLKTSRNDSTK